MEVPPKVFVVLEHPDMTYYGDAEIHGVYATKEEAEARGREVDKYFGTGASCFSVEECEIGEPE